MSNMSCPQLPIALTAGEPAGIGPDLCLQLAQHDLAFKLVVIADPDLLKQRAIELGIDIKINLYAKNHAIEPQKAGSLWVYPIKLAAQVISGQLNFANSAYVLETIRHAALGCMNGSYAAMVTAPVHKGIINDAGLPFKGHTEFIADLTGGFPVMMLATPGLRVALVTTHLPLVQISSAISSTLLRQIIRTLNQDLISRFKISKPKILVCGLNPHAGENGYLGREEIEIIEPVLNELREENIDLEGPLPADTVFTAKYMQVADVILAMYHDQGLPVLKHIGFGQAVNITLGLPIIRTSVDHGTALNLAGTGKADMGSLKYALHTAVDMINTPN